MRKNFFRKVYFPILFSLVVLVVSHVFALIIKDQEQKLVFFDIAPPTINLLATIALFWASKWTKKISRRLGLAWLFLAFSQLAYTIGDVLWAVLELGFGVSPYPSIADIFYLLNYPLFLIGTVLLTVEHYPWIEWLKRALDMVITLVASLLGSWFFLIEPLIRSGIENPVLTQILTIAYPAGDIVIFAGLIWLVNHDPKQLSKPPIILLFSGAFLTIVIDTIYSYQSYMGTYISGGYLDIGYILSYLLMGLAGFYQISHSEFPYEWKKLSTMAHKNSSIIRGILPYMPYLWLVFAYALLYVGRGSDPGRGFTELYIGVGAIIIMVILRQILSMTENRQLTSKLQNALNQVQQQTLNLENINQELEIEIQQRVRVEEQLSYDALHDSLTNLPNRALFFKRLERALEDSRDRTDLRYSVLFMDIDQFKVINDSLGHGMGDQLLVVIAQRLLKCLRGTDTVARLGGDEFVFLLENTTSENAIDFIINRIKEETEKVIMLEEHPIFITTSIGVVLDLKGYTSPGNVLRDADLAMYRAKALGKNRFEVFHDGLRLQALSRLEIEEDLRGALENHEFALYYQPIQKLLGREIVGFEALLRWNHPRFGILLPSDFLETSEEASLIQAIGEWGFNKTCSQVIKWQQIFPGFKNSYVSINFSGKQISHPGFVNMIKNTLQTNGVNPDCIRMEITESTLIDSTDTTMKKFNQLREFGIHLAIDDFGTGYSSLAYLQNFPVQSVKIDQSFIRELGIKKSSSDVIKTKLTLGRDLDVEVVAEGIETSSQLEELLQLSCEFGQGFLLSLPLTPDAVEDLLRDDPTKLIQRQ